MQVYKSLDSFKGESNIYTWIYRITLNNCLRLKNKMNKAYVESLDEKIEIFKDDIPEDKARLNRARANLVAYFSERCQWLTEDSTCSCKTRIGFALAYDPEILKRVKAQALEAGIVSKSDLESDYKPSIDELYKKFPMLEYWGKDALKEKIS